MHEALLIGLGLVALGLATGWIVRRRAPRFAHVSHYGAAALARIVAAFVLGLSVVRLLEDPDGLRIAVAVVIFVLALYVLFSAAVMTYVLVAGNHALDRADDGP
jgi:hypothetical protein